MDVIEKLFAVTSAHHAPNYTHVALALLEIQMRRGVFGTTHAHWTKLREYMESAYQLEPITTRRPLDARLAAPKPNYTQLTLRMLEDGSVTHDVYHRIRAHMEIAQGLAAPVAFTELAEHRSINYLQWMLFALEAHCRDNALDSATPEALCTIRHHLEAAFKRPSLDDVIAECCS